jgi:hypothetical protein
VTIAGDYVKRVMSIRKKCTAGLTRFGRPEMAVFLLFACVVLSGCGGDLTGQASGLLEKSANPDPVGTSVAKPTPPRARPASTVRPVTIPRATDPPSSRQRTAAAIQPAMVRPLSKFARLGQSRESTKAAKTSIKISNALAVTGIHLQLKYDPEAVAMLDVGPGNLTEALVFVGNIDSDKGLVSIAAVGIEGVNGTGQIAVLEFKPLKKSYSKIEVVELELVNEDLKQVRAQRRYGRIYSR